MKKNDLSIRMLATARKVWVQALFLCFVFAFGFASETVAQTSQTFTANGTFVPPVGVTSVTVQCWGGGGGGSTTTTNPRRGGGGGGGAYASSTLSITPLTSYQVTVGAGGAANSAGGDSWFNTNSTILAKGGFGATSNSTTGGAGGAAASCIGTVTYSGGAGWSPTAGNSGSGGGGAGTTGAGGAATSTAGGAGGSLSGGNGANGVGAGVAGAAGSVAGGGGSGGYCNSGTTRAGGAGARGMVIITWTCPTYTLASISATNPTTLAGSSTITLTAGNFTAGTFTVTYDLEGANNSTGNTVSVTFASGVGTFTVPSGSNAGTTAVTVTGLSNGTSPQNCTSTISSNNSTAFLTPIIVTATGAGTFTTPPGLTSLSVQCWGGGGGGGSRTSNGQGGGGGGGAYAANTSLTVTGNTTYNYTVGAGGTAGNTGGSSTFNTNSIIAVGGTGVASNTTAGGAGGLASASTGATKFNGGNGGTVAASVSGGGGGGAGSTGAGSAATGGSAGAGGAGNVNGIGGAGVSAANLNGIGGSAYGGGGSGACRTSGNVTGGSGAAGAVIITYTCPTYSLTSTTVENQEIGNGFLVLLTSSSAGLPVGNYTVTYSISGANTVNNATATMTVTTAGSGSFTIIPPANPGSNTLTISELMGGTAPGNCYSRITANNTSTFNFSSVFGTSSGTITIPTGVTCIYVQAWGAGGGGGTSDGNINGGATVGGGGGGGGAYAAGNVAVTAGNTYSYAIGTGGTTGNNGGNTTFNSTSIVAEGGKGVATNVVTGGSGGLASNSTGTVKYNGGSGGTGTNGTGYSGGGGAAASETAAGQSGSGSTQGTAAGTIAGDGGAGIVGTQNPGNNGGTYGGGGAGGYNTNVGFRAGGTGANGLIIISWIDPDDFSLSAAFNGCPASTITGTVTSATLAPGTYTVTYNLTGSNSVTGATASMTFASGSGTFTTASASTTGSTTITVTAITYSGFSCTTPVSTNNTATVTVTGTPSITSVTGATLCGSGVASLSATASAGTINWYTAATGGSSIATGTSYSPSVSSTTTYYVDATNAGCTTATRTAVTATVTTSVTPSVSIAASSSSICSGTSVTFTATPTNGGSAPTYQWKLNGSNVGTGGTSYTNGALVNGDQVSCVMTANNTCQTTSTATSNTVTMTVTATVTPSVSIAASSSSICDGTSVTFTATPTNGGGAPTYQWKLNGSNVGTGGTSYTNGALANGDQVSCVMTANNTCQTTSTATSNTVTMTVTANVTPSLSIGASATTICASTSVTFTASVTNGGPSPSYQWKKNGSNVGTNSTTYVTALLANNDVITCVVTSNNTCQTTNTATSNSITMTVNPNVTPSVAIGATATSICAGTSVTFTATPTNGGPSPSYQWKKNGSNVGTNSTTYTTSGLANNDVITCVITANNTCQTTNTATSNSITMSVTANVTPSISMISSATAICAGTGVTFTANAVNGGSTPIYQWYLNGSTVGTNSTSYVNSALANGDQVEVVLTANNVCQTTSSATSNIVTMSVTANVTPSVSITTTANNICAGTSVTFTATPTNGGSAPSYQWKLNGSNVGTDSDTYTSTTLVDGDVVTCVMTANNPCQTANTSTSNSQTITVISLVTFYLDDDTDGYGTNSTTTTGCSAPSGYTALGGDCDDTDPNISPIETEICDGIDQDCDGVADDGLSFTTYYVDGDGDTYGTTSAGSFCEDPGAGYSLNNTDCDDTNAAIYPNNTEICNDADDNCNSLIDDGITFTDYYSDLDFDGYGAGSAQAFCTDPGASYSLNNYDCDDTRASSYPGATEVCNGYDDDCDGSVDEGLLIIYYIDADADGYGSPSTSVNACTAPLGYSSANGDCDDTNAALNPTTIWYEDADGDGYYGNTQVGCLSPGVTYSLTHGLDDCDDAHASVNLGATEICDGLDNNCNGSIDEGVLTTYYLDSDADGYGVTTSYVQACTAPSGYAAVSGDCNDAVATANPGATETCNAVDDNCDGTVDEGCPSTVAGEEPYNALYQPAYYYSYCANFYGSLEGAVASAYAHSSCITGEDKWYTFTANSEGVTIYVGSYVNDIVIELQDASGNLVDVENTVSGIGTEIMNYYGLTAGQSYRVGIRNYNSGLSAGGTFSGCIRQLKRGGSDSGGAQWPSNISTCNIFKATYAGGTTGVQYRYTFTGLTGAAAGNVYTKTQNSDYLTLSTVTPILPSGCTYSVLVTNVFTIANGAGVNEVINAPALSPTTITITADPATQLRAVDQQSNGPRFRGAVVGSLPWVCGISNWRWRFTEVNPVTHTTVGIPIELNRGAASNFINLGTISQLQYGKTYAVQTAPIFTYTGTNYNWGPVAYMSIIGTAGMVIEGNSSAQGEDVQARIAQEEQLELSVFPNPSNGSDLMMSISGVNMENGVVRVMDAMGRVVYQNRVNVQGVLQTQLPLQNNVANGIYVLQVIGNHERAETRFIIEK